MYRNVIRKQVGRGLLKFVWRVAIVFVLIKSSCLTAITH